MLNSNSKTSDVTVIKRDGRKVRYNSDNVSRAIFRAFKDEGYGYDLSTSASFRLAEKVENKLVRANQSEVKVEDIHTAVEDVLMTSSYKNVARSYIEFRSARDRDREDTTDINVSITRLMNKDKAIVNENANKDSKTFTTNRDLTAGVVAKVEGLKMLPKAVANAHRKGEIHYHDLDYQPYSPMTNCCLIDFEGMLADGFTIGNAEVESPKSIQTAMAQVSQIIANVASSQYGGCSFNRADEVLAKYAELNYNKHYTELMTFLYPNPNEKVTSVKSVVEEATRKTKKDIYDAMQAHEYEINTLFSSNGRLAV